MPTSSCTPDALDNAVQLLRVKYFECGTLLLTPGEAAELLDLDRRTALAALQALEGAGFLELTHEGQFRLTSDQPPATGGPSTETPRAA